MSYEDDFFYQRKACNEAPVLGTHGFFIRRLEFFLELSEVLRSRKNSSENGGKEAWSKTSKKVEGLTLSQIKNDWYVVWS